MFEGNKCYGKKKKERERIEGKKGSNFKQKSHTMFN